MTPEQLKASILQYAIQGKLVEQRAEEGTGEELYRQIQTEKRRLIKAGKIKKDKPLPDIAEDEKPFDIPESWKWVYVGEIFDHNTGKAMNSSAKKVDKPGAVKPFITTSNVYWNTFDFSSVKEMFFSDDEVKRCTVTKGDILMCEGGAYFGRTAIWDFEYDICFQNHVHRLRPYQEVDLLFFYYIFFYYKNMNMMKAKGTAMPGLSSITLHQMIVPLPPLAEQKRIVAKIEELLPYIDRYAASYERLEQVNTEFPEDMNKSILRYAIQGKLVEQRAEEGTGEELYRQIQEEKKRLIKEGKIKKEKPLPEIAEDEIPFDIPESWRWVRLSDIIDVRDGTHDSPKYVPMGIPLVTSKNLSNGTIDYGNVKYITQEDAGKINARSMVDDDDILFAMIGSIGNPVLVKKDSEFCIKNMALFKKFADTDISMQYMYWFFFYAQYKLKKEASGGVQSFISLSRFREYLVPLPPYEEQIRIANKIEQILPLCKWLK